jgi:hypothetical protein
MPLMPDYARAGGGRRRKGLEALLVVVAGACAAALVVLGLVAQPHERPAVLLLHAVLAPGYTGRQRQSKQQLLAALSVDDQYAAADAAALAAASATRTQRLRLHTVTKESWESKKAAAETAQAAKPLVFPGDAAAYGADGGGSGWKDSPVGAINPVQASAQWQHLLPADGLAHAPGFVCYDPNGCEQPNDPYETHAEAVAESYADDPSYYGDGGVDDTEVGAPWHKPTPFRGSYMHATFPYENEPTGFFAGWHTVENTGLNVGMGKHRDVNQYYYPDAVRVTTGDWHFHNYDLDGSYMVPEVCLNRKP